MTPGMISVINTASHGAIAVEAHPPGGEPLPVAWVDVREFLHHGLPDAVWYALQALPPGGGVLYFAPGDWIIDNIDTDVPVCFYFAPGEDSHVSMYNCHFSGGPPLPALPVLNARRLFLDPALRIIVQAAVQAAVPAPPPPPFPVPNRDGRHIELE